MDNFGVSITAGVCGGRVVLALAMERVVIAGRLVDLGKTVAVPRRSESVLGTVAMLWRRPA